jgi:hypothetical protein
MGNRMANEMALGNRMTLGNWITLGNWMALANGMTINNGIKITLCLKFPEQRRVLLLVPMRNAFFDMNGQIDAVRLYRLFRCDVSKCIQSNVLYTYEIRSHLGVDINSALYSCLPSAESK